MRLTPAVVVLALAGCGSAAATSHPAAPRSAAPATPVERCEGSVDALLGEAVIAMEHGHADGLNMYGVQQLWGANSAVYRTFSSAEGLIIGYYDQHGAAGSVGAQTAYVRSNCAAFIREGMTP